MSEWIEVTAKTVDDAVIEAGVKLGVSIENMDYEVIEKESSGFLGLNKKPAKIRAKQKDEETIETVQEAAKEVKPVVETVEKKEVKEASETKEVKEINTQPAKDFLSKVFEAMGVKAEINAAYDDEEKTLNVDIAGDDMGILIGKRGQTLDSLQYLVSLVVNKDSESYIKVKLDTENYRERRKETLENLAKNIASKVRRTGHSVALEPMNPYERRIIHSVLQNHKYVETHSEGEEPYRKVIISLKKGVRDYGNDKYYGRSGYGKGRSGGNYNRGGYNKSGYRKYEKKENAGAETAAEENKSAE